MSLDNRNIQIIPNVGQATESYITFSSGDSSNNANVNLRVTNFGNTGSLIIEGSSGQLLTVTDELASGSIFSVNDISGIPSIEVDDTGLIKLAEYNGQVAIGRSSANTALDVAGTINITGTPETQTYYSEIGSAYDLNSSLYINPENYSDYDGAVNTSKSYFGIFNNKNVSSSNNNTLFGYGLFNNISLKSFAHSNTFVYGTYNEVARELSEDNSLNGYLYGNYNAVGHFISANSKINSNQVYGTFNYLSHKTGNIASLFPYRAYFDISGNTTSSNTTTTNLFGYQLGGVIGSASGTSYNTVTNYYGVYLQTPTVNATGSITNRFGIYQQDPAANNYFAGNVGIGTSSPVSKLDINGSANVSGQLVITDEWNASTTGGSVYLKDATGNRIEWSGSGIAPPSIGTRSVGTKLLFYPGSPSTADYAIGIDSATLWNSVNTSNSQFKWYANTTNIMTLSGTGALSATSFSGVGTGLTSLTAANLFGTIPSVVLANSTHYIGTTSVALNRASADLALTGITSVTGTTTAGLYSTTTSAVTVDSGTTGAVNIGTNANAKTITIGNATGATAIIANSGTAGIVFNQVAAGIFKVQASGAPTTDMVQITNTGQPIVTAGVNNLEVTFVGGAAAVEAGAVRLGFTPGSNTGGTWNGYRMVPTAAAATGVTMNGMKFDNITSGAGTDNMIYAGTGWDNIVNYNGTSIINGSGQINASQLLLGTIPGNIGVTAGSANSSFVEYNGTTSTAGQFDGGTTVPTGSTRLNYNGYFYANTFYGLGTGLSGTAASLTAGAVTNGVYTTGNQSIAGVKTYTDAITFTGAWDTTTGGGSIYLAASTGNRIDFNNQGAAVPAIISNTTLGTGRSAGTKLVLSPASSNYFSDDSIGVESSYVWFNAGGNGSAGFKWYSNSAVKMTLSSTGVVTANGSGLTYLNASQLSYGTIPGNLGVTAGSASSSFVEYNGTTATAGQFDGGVTTPTGNTRLNYGGYFYPTYINLVGSADTATAATHYFVETGTDGYVRPKLLADVKAELNVATTSDLQVDSLGVGTAASGTTGQIRATGTITAYYSDERLKENIIPIDSALNKINNLTGYYYNSNQLAEEFGYKDKEKQVGVIAQEVLEVLPEAVKLAPFDTLFDENENEYSKSGDNYLTVQYEKLIPLLLQAIKELSNRVEELENK